MKHTAQLLWLLLSPVTTASPLQVDTNVHIDTEALTAEAVKLDSVEHGPVRPFADTSTSTSLPKVDLGYEFHQASPLKVCSTHDRWLNTDICGGWPNFLCVREYPVAKQPVGSLRFKAAKAFDRSEFPDESKTPLNDGSKTVICPQEQPGWSKFAGNWSTQLFNPTTILDPRYSSPIEPKDYSKKSSNNDVPHQSEEFLMLNVFVPKRIYDNNDNGGELVPVIVSFHGGGFSYGSKDIAGSPAGLLKAAGDQGPAGDVIVVSVNYRLGAFGWLSGDDFTAEGGFENAGLSDQNAALEWVYQNIVSFGGKLDEITVLGESAGASSILHHLTAYGSNPSYKQRPKFKKAILQSPAFSPQTNPKEMNQIYHDFLDAVGVKTFEQLQAASTVDLIKANSKTTYYSPYGTFRYGPVLSSKTTTDTYVQYPPSLKVLSGQWFSQVQVMVATNRREGSVFTPPWLRDEVSLGAHISTIYPTMSKDALGEFAKFYPVPQTKKNLVGKVVETDERERFIFAAAAFGDLGVDCNVWLFKKSSDTYRYFYRIYPGFHGQDVGATWYSEAGDQLTSPLLNPQKQSERLQRWLTCFAKEDSNPNCANKEGDKEFKPISDGAMWIGSGVPVIVNQKQVPDEAYAMSKLPGDLPSDEICQFWADTPYWELNADMIRSLNVQGYRANEL